MQNITFDTSKPKHLVILIGVLLGFNLLIISLASIYFSTHKWHWRTPIILRSPVTVKKLNDTPIIEEEQEPTPTPTPEPEEEKVEEIEEVEAAIEVKETEQVVWKTGTVSAYSCGGITTEAERQMNCPNGVTATGVKPQVGMMACDRANLGKTFYIEGYGELTCTDTGGSIKGQGRFDIYLDTIQEAREFGVKHLAYKLVIGKTKKAI